MANADRCVCCGEIIPEGRQVCPQCDRKAENGKRLIWDEDAKRHLIALAVGHHTDTLHIDMILNAILHHAPTVDAVEVVRCKDCCFSKYFEESGTRNCRAQKGLYRTVEDYDFCSYGERKDNE